MTALEWIVFALLVACLFWPRSQVVAKFARWAHPARSRRARGARLGCASRRAPRFFERMTHETARLLLGSGAVKWK